MLDSARKSLTLSALAAALAAALVASACSVEVVEQPSPAGTSGTAGTSGSSGTTGSTSSSSGAGGAPAACGGKGGSACGPKEVCVYKPEDICGYADGSGVCQPRPDACTADCPGVCGCDGAFYCNACDAHALGVDVSDSKACLMSQTGGTVSAAGLATNVPRFIIFKTDPVRNVCFRMMVEGLNNPFIGISTPQGWTVGLLEVTDHASDCTLVNGYPAPPAGSIAKAVKASGSISLDKIDFPCEVTVHVDVAFEAQAPWTPPLESIDADMLAVEGGCG